MARTLTSKFDFNQRVWVFYGRSPTMTLRETKVTKIVAYTDSLQGVYLNYSVVGDAPRETNRPENTLFESREAALASIKIIPIDPLKNTE